MLTDRWHKATKSNPSGNCLTARWQHAKYCGTNACVETQYVDGMVEVRDSKQGPDAPVQRYTRDEWDAFLDGAKRGEFDLPD